MRRPTGRLAVEEMVKLDKTYVILVFSTNEKATVTHVGPYIGQVKYLQ